MAAVEPTIASLIVAPEEVLRPDARCPRPQCRITDDLLTKCYDTAARMGRIGNSLSHLILALSQSLQSSSADASVQSLSDTSLQAFAFMTRELGRLMASLTLARRQHNRPWIVASRLTRHGSSLLAFGELHPYRGSSLHKVMAPIVLCRWHVLVVIPGPHQLLSDPINPVGLPQGQHHRLRGVGGRGFPPPGPQEGVGAVFRGIRLTTVSDPTRRQALSQEVATLLEKSTPDQRACSYGFGP
ncbi:unnamed protein product [Boreogadus saida]